MAKSRASKDFKGKSSMLRCADNLDEACCLFKELSTELRRVVNGRNMNVYQKGKLISKGMTILEKLPEFVKLIKLDIDNSLEEMDPDKSKS